jgi:Arc/MetJ-type ribon-helix-helix transcriptional regulator
LLTVNCKIYVYFDVIIDIKIDIKIIIRYSCMENHITRTTLSLPVRLLEATDRAVKEGKAKSRNEFIAQALRRELIALKMAEIDASFAEMANDEEYHAEVETISKEFAGADWEAWKIGETQQ